MGRNSSSSSSTTGPSVPDFVKLMLSVHGLSRL